jgi:hypothetical protein
MVGNTIIYLPKKFALKYVFNNQNNSNFSKVNIREYSVLGTAWGHKKSPSRRLEGPMNSGFSW